jgi:hypothetical protein
MKNYVLEFTDNEWTLYHYDKELNNLPDIKGIEINQYFNVPDLSSLEDEYTTIEASWDNIEEEGYINIEITDPKSNESYPFKSKYNKFSEFLKDIKDLENEIEINKMNVSGWEYERKNQYKSRGLSIRDFM